MSIKVYSMKYMENQAEDLKCEYESTTSKIPNNISLWGLWRTKHESNRSIWFRLLWQYLMKGTLIKYPNLFLKVLKIRIQRKKRVQFFQKPIFVKSVTLGKWLNSHSHVKVQKFPKAYVTKFNFNHSQLWLLCIFKVIHFYLYLNILYIWIENRHRIRERKISR